MTGKELYDVYAGRTGTWSGTKGIVCGYHKTENKLIICTSNGNGWPQHDADYTGEFVTHNDKESYRYYWIGAHHIDKDSGPQFIKPACSSEYAESYVKNNFPNALEDEIDNLINAFIEGTKYRTL